MISHIIGVTTYNEATVANEAAHITVIETTDLDVSITNDTSNCKYSHGSASFIVHNALKIRKIAGLSPC